MSTPMNSRQRREAKRAQREAVQGQGIAPQPDPTVGATSKPAKPKPALDPRLKDLEPITLQVADGFTITLNPHAFKTPEGYKLGSTGWMAAGIRGQIDGRDVVGTFQLVHSNSKVK